MKGLVFDCDGVLADTERDAHRVAFNRLFAEQSLDFVWTVEGYGAALRVAGGKERLRQLLTPEFVRRHDLPSDPGTLDGLVNQWHARKTEIFVGLLDSGEVAARPGVRRLARAAASAGWKLAVASTSAHASVRAVLNRAVDADLAGEFAVFAGDDVNKKKPAPDIYLLALQHLGLSAGSAVVVEDSAIGVQAARTAGPEVVATSSAYTLSEDLSAAAIVVGSLGEPSGPELTVRKNESGLAIERVVELAHLEALLSRNNAGNEAGSDD